MADERSFGTLDHLLNCRNQVHIRRRCDHTSSGWIFTPQTLSPDRYRERCVR